MAIVLAQLAVLLFGGLMVWAAASDIARYLIPNRICLAAAGLYPAYVIAAPMPVAWATSAAIAAACFGIGAFAFGRGWFGGGDVKLLAVVALWAGPGLAAPFLFVTALAGGALGLGFLLYRTAGRWACTVGLAHLFSPAAERNAALPYGVAIAAGGLYVAGALAGAL